MSDDNPNEGFLTNFCEELIINQNATLILSVYFVFNLAILIALEVYVACKLACAPVCTNHSVSSSETPSTDSK